MKESHIKLRNKLFKAIESQNFSRVEKVLTPKMVEMIRKADWGIIGPTALEWATLYGTEKIYFLLLPFYRNKR